MKGYKNNIEQLEMNNTDFRRVLYTSHYCQLVLMSLKPGESIGMETHGNDQFFRFERGTGKVIIDKTTYKVGDGDAVIVPAGCKHNVINTSKTEYLRLYTLYSPPHHKDGVVHKTKKAAEADDEEFLGKTSE